MLGYAIHLCQFFQHCNWSFRASFLRLLVGLLLQLNMPKIAISAISASCFWNAALTHGKVLVTTRRIGTISPLTWDFVPLVNRAFILFVRWCGFSLSVSGCLRIWCRRGRSFLFLNYAPVSRSFNPMIETTRVSFKTVSSCLPLPAISHFPLNVGSISFSTPFKYSSMNYFVLGFEVSTSHLWSNIWSHGCFSILNNLLSIVSYRFLIIQSQQSL